jgi:NarL family two-component system response regulator LiaR
MSTAYASGNNLAERRDGRPDTEPAPLFHTRIASGQARARVLIASAQPLVRHGLHALLANELDLEVVGETDDGSDAVQLARRLRPDVVMIELLMPTIDGISATRTICAELRDTHVIVMSGINEDASVVESIRAGAVAYLERSARIEDLLRAIREAAAGQVVLPARAASRLVRLGGRHEALTERETEVLHLVARGLDNKQVARQLGLAMSTVKHHVGSVLAKLGLPSRTQVALYAARTGLVALDRLGSEAAVGTRGVLRGV